MKCKATIIFIIFLSIIFQNCSRTTRIEESFDDSWKFHLGNIQGAEEFAYNDQKWRDIDLPHDWSIEKLPGQEPGKVVGPFSIDSPGKTATGHTVGGTAWYRKKFTLSPDKTYSRTIINFDGVYMNCDVWVNGKLVGSHPYGYTAFHYDISEFLNPSGTENVIAVKVKNEGKNSRWYSGSGIYRHVTLIQKQNISVSHNGVFISTVVATPDEATIQIAATVDAVLDVSQEVKLAISIAGPGGEVLSETETEAEMLATELKIIKDISIPNPELWSIEEPNLYTANIKVIANNKVTDEVSATFGIRTIHFDAQTGFTLNGKPVLLKGGCLHHDNGFLGAAAIDRAEERRVELMKNYGFNAIRSSHNPPSDAFLDACDRIGVLVIDEAFDQWQRPKNPEDYHLYFDEWWEKDLESMINRDKNHPSVIFWSIGNEINERADSAGFVIRKKLVKKAKELDPTRPVTEGICGFWDHPGQEWSTTIPAFADLDISGYNYRRDQYDADHAKFPNRIIMATESYPGDSYEYWQYVKNHPHIIGDFVWTSMDYLGETGIGHTRYTDDPDKGLLRQWPWFNAYCGDIDLCGNKKPQLLYRDVIWDNSELEIAVHTPLPEGKTEFVNYWGWPDEVQSWNWVGHEGQELDVRVFSSYPVVRLELNEKVIAEKKISDSSRYIANFKVPYERGVLKAIAVVDGEEVATKELQTTGIPSKINLVPDKSTIKADRNDLAFVKVEITDSQGNIVPDAAIPMTFSISGSGEIAGSGNSCPYDMESFNNPVCTSYRGKALVIIRPLMNKSTGMIILNAKAEGLETGEIYINVQ